MYDVENSKKICQSCGTIGKKLNHEAICKIAEEAETALNYPSKLRVAVIANQFRAAASVLKETFGINALPEEIKPFQIAASAKILYTKQEVESNEPAYSVKVKSEQPVVLTLGRKEEVLNNIDAEILYSQNNYEDFDWKKELMEIDYIFFAVSATQMLSTSERKFVEEVIVKYYGVSRFVIVLTDTEMINSVDDYNELISRLKRYLSSVQAEEKFYELGTETLQPYAAELFVKDKDELRSLAAYTTARVCYEDMKEELLKLKEEASLDIEEIEKDLDILKKRENTIKMKGAQSAGYVWNELRGSVYYDISSAHQDFFNKMSTEISKTIDSSSNIEKTRKQIYEYMESSIESFMKHMERGFQQDLWRIGEELEKRMHSDAGDYFKDVSYIVLDDGGWLPEVRPSASDFLHSDIVIEVPDKIERTDKVSKVMMFFSLPFLVKGRLLRAFGAAAGGWILKKKAKTEAAEATAELLKQAMKAECAVVQSEHLGYIKEQIYKGADWAEERVKKAYEGFAGAVMAEMYELKEKAEYAYSKKEVLDQIFSEDLTVIETELEIR